MRVKVGIASHEAIKKRTLAIAKGDFIPDANDPKIWFTSQASMARLLNADNRALLREIYLSKPASLKELAQKTGRHASNLSRTLKTMTRYDLVVLEKQNGRLCPRTNITGIELTLDF